MKNMWRRRDQNISVLPATPYHAGLPPIRSAASIQNESSSDHHVSTTPSISQSSISRSLRTLVEHLLLSKDEGQRTMGALFHDEISIAPIELKEQRVSFLFGLAQDLSLSSMQRFDLILHCRKRLELMSSDLVHSSANKAAADRCRILIRFKETVSMMLSGALLSALNELSVPLHASPSLERLLPGVPLLLSQCQELQGFLKKRNENIMLEIALKEEEERRVITSGGNNAAGLKERVLGRLSLLSRLLLADGSLRRYAEFWLFSLRCFWSCSMIRRFLTENLLQLHLFDAGGEGQLQELQTSLDRCLARDQSAPPVRLQISSSQRPLLLSVGPPPASYVPGSAAAFFFSEVVSAKLVDASARLFLLHRAEIHLQSIWQALNRQDQAEESPVSKQRHLLVHSTLVFLRSLIQLRHQLLDVTHLEFTGRLLEATASDESQINIENIQSAVHRHSLKVERILFCGSGDPASASFQALLFSILELTAERNFDTLILDQVMVAKEFFIRHHH